VALANIKAFEDEDILGHVNRLAPVFRSALETLTDLPIVGEIRGEGFFYGIELVKDRDTRATFNDDEAERLLRGYLSGALFEKGLICRADDRGDPVVQLAPPLISTEVEIEFIVETLRKVLEHGLTKI
jgi:adenosylmethionine-8-amino-7-oxononanoate aminotransferase